MTENNYYCSGQSNCSTKNMRSSLNAVMLLQISVTILVRRDVSLTSIKVLRLDSHIPLNTSEPPKYVSIDLVCQSIAMIYFTSGKTFNNKVFQMKISKTLQK